jgi:hypothetical protein
MVWPFDSLLSGSSGPNSGGILSGNAPTIDPTTALLSSMAAGVAPLMGATRLPNGGFGAALAGAASGIPKGMMLPLQQQYLGQQIQTGALQNAALMARFRDIASRHPEWFGGTTSSPMTGGVFPGLSGQTPGPGTPSGGPLMPPNGAGANGSSNHLALNGANVTDTSGTPAPIANSGSSVPGGSALSGGANGVLSGNNLDDAADYLFIHPEMKDIVSKMFAGPTDVQRAMDYAYSLPGGPQRDLAMLGVYKAVGLSNNENVRGGSFVLQRDANGNMRPVFFAPKIPEGAGPTANGGIAPLPNAANTISTLSRAQASGPATFKPLVSYDAAGNEIISPSTVLGGLTGAGAGSAGGTPSPASAPDFSGARLPPAAPSPSPVPMAFKAAVQPQAAAPTLAPPAQTAAQPLPPQAGGAAAATNPVQFGAPNIPTQLDNFLPPNYQPPQRPAAPPGSLMGAPGPGFNEIAKNDAERLAGYERELSGGQKIYTNLEQMYSILGRGLSTGKMTDAASSLANFAQQAGYGYLIPKNFDPNDAAAFNKLATDLIFTSLKQLPGQPRVAEIEGLKQANPSLAMPPAANLEILNSTLSDQRWKDARANLAKQYMARYGTLGDFDARFNGQYPAVDVFNQVQNQAANAGWKLPGSPGTPSNPTSAAIANDARAQQVQSAFQKGMYGDPKSQAARDAARAALSKLGYQ